MTARLVALMAFVLFLCLGAFSLLLRTSRDIVIEEAEETLRSTTLKTLDALHTANLGLVLDGRVTAPMFDVTASPAKAAVGTPVVVGDDDRRVVFERKYRGAVTGANAGANAGADAGTGERDTATTAAPAGAPLRVIGVTRVARAIGPDANADGSAEGVPPAALQKLLRDGAPGAWLLEDVRVSKDHADGKPGESYALTLAFTANEANGVDPMPPLGVKFGAGPDADEHLVKFFVPNRVDTVFQSAQQQSLWWFIGVLAVGTVLSAGLARRFTRPIRDLDGALRRLSDGDLDVTVDVTSKHEVGRLQSAFNAMATRLKQGRELEKALHRREKLAALGRLAAGVAHDVRNPLHSIQLTLDHLSETARPVAEATAREFERGVRLIRGEVERLDRLVEDFLCFARTDVRRVERVDVAALLNDVAQFVANEAQRRQLALAIDATPGATMLDANPESLRSALLNLVLNGFEAMSPGGTLTLRARASSATCDGVVLEVEDTGRGIAREDQERVFEFGFTTRSDGHGLGLAMVHQIVVEEHGGRIQLDSAPNAGTRVRIELPARAAQADAPLVQEVA